MAKLKTSVTSKGQTTVPKQSREILGIGPHDDVSCEIVERKVQLSSGEPKFFRWIGSIRLGCGSVSADIERARWQRGILDGRR